MIAVGMVGIMFLLALGDVRRFWAAGVGIGLFGLGAIELWWLVGGGRMTV